MPDQAQLEAALERELRSLTDGLSPRRDLLGQAIVRRRRSRRRAQLAGATTVIAASVAAVVLATGAGSARPALRGTQGLNVHLGGGRTHDTAYIVTRVKARVAADARRGTLIRSSAYGSGDVRPDGSIVDLRYREYSGYHYAAADGAVYWHGTLYAGEHGTHFEEIDDWVPGTDGQVTSTRILINLDKRTYSENRYQSGSAPRTGPTPNLLSSPSQVQKALRDGMVTDKGAATIDGRRAIALAVRLPGPRRIDHETMSLVLYVDAKTYRPLRSLYASDGHLNLEIDDWVPATPRTVAMAESQSIPAGYQKVAKPY